VKLSGVYGVIFQCGLTLLNAGFDSAQRRRLSPIFTCLWYAFVPSMDS
jgi:hypothetical protein